MSDKPINLDRLAAQHAQALIKSAKDDIETTVTKTLGVLQEDGVYACFLYLLAKEKENGKATVAEMLNLLDGLKFGWGKPASNKPEDILSHITEKVTVHLERLLLAKETLEQMLIYARYGAKARKDAEPEKGQSDSQENQS
ncbi:MAG: hypothetical protein HC780_01335 [Leptolyngbyaceae cyanobacterium CSU_1_3]|nr:hypothetical protein [Leptolyngbyaceae cyanobacterium CSU_1_3]